MKKTMWLLIILLSSISTIKTSLEVYNETSQPYIITILINNYGSITPSITKLLLPKKTLSYNVIIGPETKISIEYYPRNGTYTFYKSFQGTSKLIIKGKTVGIIAEESK